MHRGLAEGLGEAGSLPELIQLELKDCNIQAAAGAALGAFLASRCPKISKLGLWNNPDLFTEEGLRGFGEGLGEAGGLPELTELVLYEDRSKRKIGAAEAKELGAFLTGHCPKLTKLDLRKPRPWDAENALTADLLGGFVLIGMEILEDEAPKIN